MAVAKTREKIISSTGSISGFASILGSWQVCHNVCLGIIALLSVMGIVVTGMPLLFLTKLAIPFWTVAFILLLITIFLYFKKKCISIKLILFNSGLIIAGTPFQPLQNYSIVFYITGGLLALLAISMYLKEKIRKNEK
jgi:hypothetical protein